MAITTPSTVRALQIQAGDPLATSNLASRIAGNVGEANKYTIFNQQLMQMLRQAQEAGGTQGLKNRQLDLQSEQAGRLMQEAEPGMSPSLQESVRQAQAGALTPSIQGISSRTQTFQEQLSSFKDILGMAQNIASQAQAAEEKSKADAQNLIQQSFAQLGSSAFKGANQQDVAALEKMAGYPKGFLTSFSQTLAERELAQEAPKTMETSQGIFQWNPQTSRWESTGMSPYEKETGIISPTAATVDQIANALKQIETGGNIQARGAAGERGAYQFMPATWNKYSEEYATATGQYTSLNINDPNAQEEVAKFKIQQWLKQGYSPEQIARIWNSGSPTGNVPQYVSRFNQALNNIMGQTGGKDTALVQSIITNPQLYYTLTATKRQEILPQLQGQGFDITQLVSPTLVGKAKEKVDAFNTAQTMLDTIENKSQKIIKATTISGMMGQTLKNIKAKIPYLGAQLEPEFKVYNDTIESFLTMLSRATGEKGVITNQDVARIQKALPNSMDTLETANQKMQTLRNMFTSIMSGGVSAYTGQTNILSGQQNNDPLGIR